MSGRGGRGQGCAYSAKQMGPLQQLTGQCEHSAGAAAVTWVNLR